MEGTYWTVLYETEPKGKSRFVMCRCVCGNKRKVAYNNIKSGRSKSCGCRGKGLVTGTDPVAPAARVDDRDIRKFAAAILLRAAADYKRASGKSESAKHKREELEKFFLSPYCDDLIQLSGMEQNGKELIDSIKAKSSGRMVRP